MSSLNSKDYEGFGKFVFSHMISLLCVGIWMAIAKLTSWMFKLDFMEVFMFVSVYFLSVGQIRMFNSKKDS